MIVQSITEHIIEPRDPSKTPHFIGDLPVVLAPTNNPNKETPGLIYLPLQIHESSYPDHAADI